MVSVRGEGLDMLVGWVGCKTICGGGGRLDEERVRCGCEWYGGGGERVIYLLNARSRVYTGGWSCACEPYAVSRAGVCGTGMTAVELG